MNKPKGKMTEGPFTCEWDKYGGYDCMTAAYLIKGSKDKVLATVDCSVYGQKRGDYESPAAKSPEAEANAYWMTKAWALPKLLEAAKTALGTLDDTLVEFRSKWQVHTMKELEKAIAKIEGEGGGSAVDRQPMPEQPLDSIGE